MLEATEINIRSVLYIAAITDIKESEITGIFYLQKQGKENDCILYKSNKVKILNLRCQLYVLFCIEVNRRMIPMSRNYG